ncbi:unnamed protein product [Acanthoscelides obtectus]|uniref:Uncharacterized protein n=1 Tax=Acanthoscelides obtectus TaxID=200917 RepID=A0A9P0KVK0_ACAOB|nr:unnamed protein product [Acanthoscelides obtectus]CAK1639229.1 hypothetical protein AOBTE_LOCUS11057 [Acanthoscelides obtectus]
MLINVSGVWSFQCRITRGCWFISKEQKHFDC